MQGKSQNVHLFNSSHMFSQTSIKNDSINIMTYRMPIPSSNATDGHSLMDETDPLESNSSQTNENNNPSHISSSRIWLMDDSFVDFNKTIVPLQVHEKMMDKQHSNCSEAGELQQEIIEPNNTLKMIFDRVDKFTRIQFPEFKNPVDEEHSLSVISGSHLQQIIESSPITYVQQAFMSPISFGFNSPESPNLPPFPFNLDDVISCVSSYSGSPINNNKNLIKTESNADSHQILPPGGDSSSFCSSSSSSMSTLSPFCLSTDITPHGKCNPMISEQVVNPSLGPVSPLEVLSGLLMVDKNSEASSIINNDEDEEEDYNEIIFTRQESPFTTEHIDDYSILRLTTRMNSDKNASLLDSSLSPDSTANFINRDVALQSHHFSFPPHQFFPSASPAEFMWPTPPYFLQSLPEFPVSTIPSDPLPQFRPQQKEFPRALPFPPLCEPSLLPSPLSSRQVSPQFSESPSSVCLMSPLKFSSALLPHHRRPISRVSSSTREHSNAPPSPSISIKSPPILRTTSTKSTTSRSGCPGIVALPPPILKIPFAASSPNNSISSAPKPIFSPPYFKFEPPPIQCSSGAHALIEPNLTFSPTSKNISCLPKFNF